MKKFRKQQWLGSTMLCVVFGTTPAWAQVTPAPSTTPPTGDVAAAQSADGSPPAKGDIVVTGSRIRQRNLQSVSPIVTVGQEEAKARGLVRAEDLINSLPQASPDFGANINLGSTGTATANLRGLGSSRTLVLIDGRRLMPGDPSPAGNVADLNAIPLPLVERVEVLTGGASAVYGADAVAGVVNFIMLKDFDGVRVEGQTSFYQHTNDNKVAQDALRARGQFAPEQYPIPKRHITDGTTYSVNVVVGTNTGNGRGNVTLYADYLRANSIPLGNRDYGVCIFNSGATLACQPPATAPTSRIRLGPPGSPAFIVDPVTGNFRAVNANTDLYNGARLRNFQRPDTRYSIGALGHYELSDAADVYAQLMMTDDRSYYQVEPTNFTVFVPLNCDTPLFSPQQAATVCGAAAGTPVPTPRPVVLVRRTVDLGIRRQNWRHTSYRVVSGVRGDLGNAWHYDAYGQYGDTIYKLRFTNDVSNTRSANAFDVVRTPSGQIVCRSADPNCVPYNVFSVTPNPAASDYVRANGTMTGDTRETVLSGSITGDLGVYGVRAPWAENGVGVAFGAEYRKEELKLEPDDEFRTGDIFSSFPQGVEHGQFSVKELFSEIRVPIAEHRPFAERLAVEAGYRYSKYSTGFSTDTYKIGGDWAPVRDVRFRASYQRAVRAPNLWDLFSTQAVVFDARNDPCAGPVPDATPAQCARTGITPAQYGNVPFSSTGAYNGLIGGNPDIGPEKSNSFTAGAVLTPRFLPGFSLSADWYDIKIKGAIGSIGADVILQRCVDTGNPFYCSKIHRDQSGSLSESIQGFVDDLNFNLGGFRTNGVDIEANHRFSLADLGLRRAGSLSFNVVGTWTHRYGNNVLPDDPTTECAGFYGVVCGTPSPHWRHKARLTWETPWRAGLSVAWRHIDSVRNGTRGGEVTAFATDIKVPSRDYFDLSGSWNPVGKIDLRAGVNNIFDKDPPLIGLQTAGLGAANGNTYAQVYDALGRYVFFGASLKF